ncbi:hypothetical protein IW261DRAFT_1567986 [Armillaria novae-zelandiae]|uniref:DEAD/DEAH box helicase domain-containing protein n=1 Tax=Armillaria novae-zelandiae TaxID=153914 RepID=A0AA39UAA7_9AGAR|nr:hypothetical protein IW261DRAFT_1567986 [Armillaria novae-zelandiae]
MNNYDYIRTRSYCRLDEARNTATTECKYNSTRTQQEIQFIFKAKFGKPAYDWQLNVAEAMLVGLDTVLIAGTGAGKTIPFMLPLLLDKQKKVLVGKVETHTAHV